MRSLEDHLKRLLAANGDAAAGAAALGEALRSEHGAVRERAAELLIDALGPAAAGPRVRILRLLQSAWWPADTGLAARAHQASVLALGQMEDEGAEVEDVVLLWTNLARVEPGEVERILEGLGNPAWAVRRAAAGAVGRLLEVGPTQLSRLLEALSDPDERVALAALDSVGALAASAPARTVPALRDEVRTGKGLRRFKALTALRGVMEEGVGKAGALLAETGSLESSLLDALEDPEEGVRLQAAAVLGLRGANPVAVEAALARALSDESVDVAATAAAAMLRLGAASEATLRHLETWLGGPGESQVAVFTALEPLEPSALARARAVLQSAASAGPEEAKEGLLALLAKLD